MRLRLALICLLALLAAFSGAESKRVLGKLGQATDRTSIYASMSRGSHVYYRLKPYQYLVVQDTDSSNWYRVLLQNGAYGYVSASKVAKLPYTVTSNRGKRASRYSGAVASRGASAPSSSRKGTSSIIQEGLNHVGTPYVWGGDDINNGIDCSGFVKKLFGNVGVNLPRTASEQALVGQPIRRLEELRQGDRLYFWERKRGKIGHTGIYMGGGYFIHSSRGHNGVATDYLGSPKWLKILVAARRS